MKQICGCLNAAKHRTLVSNLLHHVTTKSKVHGANMGPMILVIRDDFLLRQLPWAVDVIPRLPGPEINCNQNWYSLVKYLTNIVPLFMSHSMKCFDSGGQWWLNNCYCPNNATLARPIELNKHNLYYLNALADWKIYGRIFSAFTTLSSFCVLLR